MKEGISCDFPEGMETDEWRDFGQRWQQEVRENKKTLLNAFWLGVSLLAWIKAGLFGLYTTLEKV